MGRLLVQVGGDSYLVRFHHIRLGAMGIRVGYVLAGWSSQNDRHCSGPGQPPVSLQPLDKVFQNPLAAAGKNSFCRKPQRERLCLAAEEELRVHPTLRLTWWKKGPEEQSS